MSDGPAIIIIGAGPAGAMLAYLLARRGIKVTLVERQHDFEREFRGEILMPSGVEVFRQAGLAEQFKTLPLRALHEAEFFIGNRSVGKLELTKLIGPDAAFTAVSQPAMLEILVQQASQFPTFQFLRGAAMRELVIQNDRIAGVEVVEHGEPRRIMADLVIAADGRASTVRKKSGLDAVRRPQAFDIVWCKVPMLPSVREFGDRAQVFLGRGHFALAFPSFDDRLQMAWVIRKGSIGELRTQGIEHWVEQMARHVSSELGEHLRANTKNITLPFLLDVICDLMPVWTRPGLLLIGDAAHPMSPVGGQGLNVALRDAVVAANHLIAVCRQGFAPAALDEAARRVQHDRMPEVEAVQRTQNAVPRFLFASPALSRVVLFLMPLLARRVLTSRAASTFARRLAFGVAEVRLNPYDQ